MSVKTKFWIPTIPVRPDGPAAIALVGVQAAEGEDAVFGKYTPQATGTLSLQDKDVVMQFVERQMQGVQRLYIEFFDAVGAATEAAAQEPYGTVMLFRCNRVATGTKSGDEDRAVEVSLSQIRSGRPGEEKLFGKYPSSQIQMTLKNDRAAAMFAPDETYLAIVRVAKD